RLLEQVDDGVLVGAEGQRRARVIQLPGWSDAVGEVPLGRGAAADRGAGAAQRRDVLVAHMRRVNRGRERTQNTLDVQQCGGGHAVEPWPRRVLGRLFREVDVKWPTCGSLGDHPELVAWHCAHGVDGGTDT